MEVLPHQPFKPRSREDVYSLPLGREAATWPERKESRMAIEETRKDGRSDDDANDPNAAPVDGPGGDEGEGGLGATSQDSPGEVEGGGTSGS